MNTPAETPEAPPAGRRRSWQPYLVWILPAGALIIVVVLAVQWLQERGEVVTVTFSSAAEAQPGDTKVLYQGAEAGHLIKILPNEDGRRIDFELRLVPEAKPGLNTNARFWLIGASPNLEDLNSLKGFVAGVAIGYAPGTGGTPTRRFEGLEKAPIVLPGDRGTRYRLQAATLGSIRERADVLYRGQPIGKVTDVKFRDDGSFDLGIFVFKPYDALIKEGVHFWKSSPVRLSFAGGGVNVTLAPASTLLSGSIDLENSSVDPRAPQSPPESAFKLYADSNAARQGLSGPSVPYDFVFTASGGDLERGAPVTLLGFEVGEVTTSRLDYDERTHEPITLVTALLYPQRLDPSATAPGAAADPRSSLDARLRELLHLGYRARLEQTPALVGARSIALVPVKGVGFVDLAHDGPNPRIPSAPGATGIDDIASQADQILAKVNRIPIEKIGNDIAVVTSRLHELASSPKTEASLAHLAGTLADIDETMAQVKPQIGPLMTKLNDAAGQLRDVAVAARRLLDGDGQASDTSLPETINRLDDALRSIQSLADYLDRHPDALIRGKRPEN